VSIPDRGPACPFGRGCRGSRYRSNGEVDGGDTVGAELAVLLARLGELADAPVDDPAIGGGQRINRNARYEQVRAAVAAAQHTEMVAFGRTQVEEQAELIAAGRLDPEKLVAALPIRSPSPLTSRRGRGRGDSLSRARWPSTCRRPRALLATGRISERLAETIVAQTTHLDAAARRAVDKALADARLDEVGFRWSGTARCLAASWAICCAPPAGSGGGGDCSVTRATAPSSGVTRGGGSSTGSSPS